MLSCELFIKSFENIFLCKIKRSLGNIMAFVISLLSGVQVTFFSNLTCVMSDLKEEGFMINYSDTLPSPPAEGFS